jgi:cathepsin B
MSDDRRSTSAKRRNIVNPEEEKRAQATADRARQAIKNRKKSSFWDQYSYHIIIGGFIFIIAVTILSTLFGKTKKLSLTPVIELDEIESHNSHNLGYKLGPNSFFQDQTLADAKKIFSNFFSYKQSLSRCTSLDENVILEPNYDFRQAHPHCVSPVVDQKNCSSSYAVASAGAISDRFCIATNQNVRLSAQQVLSCQEDNEGKECEGGDIAGFLDFAKRKGLVDENCFPYQGEPNVACDPAIQQCPKYFIQDYCVANGPEGLKRDIIQNGPLIGYLPAYRDFLVYKSGVYRVQEGTSKFQGGHAIKLIGWGTSEDGEQYWIAENSWGNDWGMKGFAHIAMGQEDLFLDHYAFSASPRVEKEGTPESGKKEQDEVVNA